ncbi:MAG: serine--tRNA ligase [Pyrinomonadaceae bacterium]|nr:serine--tRNA ligase [Phycisphaerales bacterium]
MIDLKQLRENPDRFRDGCRKKNMPVDIDRLLALDVQRRTLVAEQESLRAEQKRLEKDLGPQMGKLSGELKKADPARRDALQRELDDLKAKPTSLKTKIQSLEEQSALIEPELNAILLTVPLPPDADVPVGTSSEDNIQLKTWNPDKTSNGPTAGFDPTLSYEQNRGFRPRTHLELVKDLGLADFDRGVRMAGTRSYVLTGDGMLLHNAILRYAFDFMTLKNGFKAMSVPVVVREECMVGTGFFPAGREQAYLVDETHRNNPDAAGTPPPTIASTLQQSGGNRDLFLTGTGEVGLMGLHQGEILREEDLPLRYTTVSTCFRREAGAAGKDTAGLYRIHQFDKVEQVVICKASESDSRAWHKTMIGYVEELLQSLGLPYRLLQCCTGDLGVKNADMIDIECWMPGRGNAVQKDGNTTYTGAYGETHSASRLYDFQCRRLNMRYRAGGEQGQGPTTVCHSLNNTVAASPRILIPILEMYQNADGSVTVPEVLRQYMGGKATITRA